MSKKLSIKAGVRSAKAEDRRLRDQIAKKTSDSLVNFVAKLGLGADNAMSGATYGFNPITRQRTLLEWVHRGSWLGGVAVDLVADDMTRAGIEILGDLPPDQIQELDEAATSLAIWNRINETAKWARLYGGSLAFMMIDGQDTKTPLRLDTIGKGAFKGLLVLDRWMVEPTLGDLVDEFGPDMGMPKFYRITANAPGIPGMTIHHSRCLRLEGIRLPYWQRMMENLWGLSVLERLYDRMIAFDSASTGAAQLVYKAFIRTYKLENLRETISSGGDALNQIVKFVDMMRRFQSVEGITIIDSKDEMVEGGFSGFSGLSDVLLQFGQQLAGSLQIPLVRLFGQSPAGLNSTGESDLRTYYDGINNQQNSQLKVPVTRIYRALAKSMGMKVGEGFGIKFNPLWQLTDKEKADIAQVHTNTVAEAEESGIISHPTALKELKQMSRVTGIFTNISEEDIQAAEVEPAPTLPESEGAVPGAKVEPHIEKPAEKAEAKTPFEKVSEGLPFGSKDSEDSNEEGGWITINGEHVFVKGGKITKGPQVLVGKSPSNLEGEKKAVKTFYHGSQSEHIKGILKEGLDPEKSDEQEGVFSTSDPRIAIRYAARRTLQRAEEQGLSEREAINLLAPVIHLSATGEWDPVEEQEGFFKSSNKVHPKHIQKIDYYRVSEVPEENEPWREIKPVKTRTFSEKLTPKPKTSGGNDGILEAVRGGFEFGHKAAGGENKSGRGL